MDPKRTAHRYHHDVGRMGAITRRGARNPTPVPEQQTPGQRDEGRVNRRLHHQW